MADKAVQTRKNEARAETLPAAIAAKAPAAEPVKAEPAKQESAKAEAANAEPAQAESAKAEAAKAEPARQEPAKSAAPAVKAAAKAVEKPARAAPKTIRARKPAKKKPAARKAKPARPAVNATRPARAGATLIRKGAKTMTNQTNKATEAAAQQIKTVIGDANERAKTAMEKSAKIVEELADLTRGNVEALVASSKVAAKGVETLSQDAAEYGRKSFEGATQAFKSFAEVKSATDLFKLQGDFARRAFDNAVAESARVSEIVLKLAGDVAEPLTSRYSVAAERVKTLAA